MVLVLAMAITLPALALAESLDDAIAEGNAAIIEEAAAEPDGEEADEAELVPDGSEAEDAIAPAETTSENGDETEPVSDGEEAEDAVAPAETTNENGDETEPVSDGEEAEDAVAPAEATSEDGDGAEPVAMPSEPEWEEADNLELVAMSVKHSQSEAVAWAKARASEGWNVDYDGSYGVQCVDLILYYYDYLTGSHTSGNAIDYTSNTLPSGWTRVSSSPQPGDVIVWKRGAQLSDGSTGGNEWADSTYGHIGIVTGVASGYVTTVETNTYTSRPAATHKRLTSGVACYIRPDFTIDGTRMETGYSRVLPDGQYAIVLTSTKSSDPYYFLDIYGSDSTAPNKSNVQLFKGTGKPKDLVAYDTWYITYSDGFYTITQTSPTGPALDVVGAHLARGTNVDAYAQNGTEAQQWAISQNGSGYRLEARCNGFSLDVDGGDVVSGQNIQVWTSNDTEAQRWSFIPIGELCDSCDPLIPDGDYAIVVTSTLGSDPYYFLDIYGADSTAPNKSNVQLFKGTGKPEDLVAYDTWHVAYADGFYTITQKGTSVALDVAGASLNMGTNVQAYEGNSSTGQQWAITRNGDGYRVRSRCNGYSLDVAAGTIESGTNVRVWQANSTVAQCWSFVPVGRDISKAVVAEIEPQEYTGSPVTPGLAVEWDGIALTEGVDYTLAYSDNVGPGTATATITGRGSYVGTKAVTFEIVPPAPVDLSGADVALPFDLAPCTGKAIEPEVTVTLGGEELAQGTDYEVTYANNVEVGTATVTVTGVGGYAGTATATFRIARPANGWYTFADGAKGYGRDGRLVTGWMDLGDAKYWFGDDGRMATGWTDVEVSGKVMHFYFNPASGNLVRSTWFQIDGVTYYFRASGNMATGWATISDNGVDKKYYFDEGGQMMTGWRDIDNGAGVTNHYYFRPSGSMATEWATIDGVNYYFRPSGNMATGFTDVVSDAYKRYFDEQGHMVTGWRDIGGNTYYFRSSGAMQTGEAVIDGAVCVFTDKGVLIG